MSDKDLPNTTQDDLRKLGLTPEILRAKFESRGWVVRGKTLGICISKSSGMWGKEQTMQCRNSVLQPWKAVDQQPPVPGQQHTYNQVFENYDSEAPSDVNFTNDTTVTTGTDYSMTSSYDLSVNAGLNLGPIGHVNINASMSHQEVQQLSKTETKSHTVNFSVKIPAYAGKLVAETTTEYTATTIFESKIGPVGTVGILTEDPMNLYIFYDIHQIFPELFQTGRVVQTTIDTEIKTSIVDIARPKVGDSAGQKPKVLTGKGHKRSYLTYRTPRFPEPIAAPTAACIPLTRADLAELGIVDDTLPADPPVYNSILGMQLIFKVANPVPEGQPRINAANQFRFQILNAVAAGTIQGVGEVSPWRFVGGQNPESAKCDITFGDPPIHEHDLEEAIRLLAPRVNWGGHNYKLLFT